MKEVDPMHLHPMDSARSGSPKGTNVRAREISKRKLGTMHGNGSDRMPTGPFWAESIGINTAHAAHAVLDPSNIRSSMNETDKVNPFLEQRRAEQLSSYHAYQASDSVLDPYPSVADVKLVASCNQARQHALMQVAGLQPPGHCEDQGWSGDEHNDVLLTMLSEIIRGGIRK
jgi:hypothetical protein